MFSFVGGINDGMVGFTGCGFAGFINCVRDGARVAGTVGFGCGRGGHCGAGAFGGTAGCGFEPENQFDIPACFALKSSNAQRMASMLAFTLATVMAFMALMAACLP
jgi:hypothetical protein